MRLRLAFLLSILALALVRPAVAGDPPALAPGGWGPVAARVVPATVAITAVKIVSGKKNDGLGQREDLAASGFIVDPSGIVVTNKHVIAGALRIIVRLHDGDDFQARLVAVSPVIDLALLRIDAGHPLPFLKLAPGDTVRPGDPVLAVGNPLGLGLSLSSGIVSATRRSLMETPFDDYVQTDAAINHGNSGGPLIDSEGEVVGLNTILLTNQPNEGSNGLGFAISSAVVAAALRHLLHPDERPIGWLGLHMQAMTSGLRRAFALPMRGGVMVTAIDPASPAREAGLQPGDVILRYGEQVPANPRQLMREIATTPIGSEVTLTVWTATQTRRVTLQIRRWPQEAESPSSVLAPPDSVPPPPVPELGLLLAPIDATARKAFGLGDAQGVLVIAADNISEAYARGLRPGTVIERVQGKTVTTPAEFFALVRQAARETGTVALLGRWSNGVKWVTLHTGPPAPAPEREGLQDTAAAQR